jgi:hypothetical protein
VVTVKRSPSILATQLLDWLSDAAHLAKRHRIRDGH